MNVNVKKNKREKKTYEMKTILKSFMTFCEKKEGFTGFFILTEVIF